MTGLPWSERVESWGLNQAVVALSIARLSDALGNSIIFIVIPLYVARLPAPWFRLPLPVLVGILISLYGLINAMLQPIAGALSDRLQRRKPFIQIGLLIMGGSTLGFVAATRFTDLLLLRALQGVGLAFTVPAAMALMATATKKEHRGAAMGVYTTLRMAGFSCGPLVGGYLQVHYGFDTAFYTGAGAILLGIVLVQLWVREPAPAAARGGPAPGGRLPLFDRSLINAGILGAALATFLMAGNFSMMSTLENEFNHRLHETAIGFSIAFSALMVSRLLFQVPLGRLSDRIGRKPLIIAGLILMMPSTAALGLAQSTTQLTWMRLFQGLASAGIAAPTFALAADLSRRGGEGRQMSIITMGFGLGIALGPLLAGLLAVVSFEAPFLIGGLASLAGAWVVFRYVPETVGARRSTPEAEPAA